MGLTNQHWLEMLSIISFTLILTIAFYFINPVDFTEKLSYATVVMLVLLNLIERVLRLAGETIDASRS